MRVLLCSVLLLLLACEGEELIGQHRSAIIYGDDDRVEVYAHPEETIRALASDSTLALIPYQRIEDPTTLREKELLCADEPFGDQPAAAVCSAVLIDADLILTSGHCIQDEASCRKMRFVLGYHYQEQGRLAASAIYGCRQLLLQRADSNLSETRLDYAVLQIDRPVMAPAIVFRDELSPNETLIAIGNGAGLPTKIDDGGVVIDPRAGDYFYATTDTFAGSSGAGVFDQQHRLVGIVSRGRTDFEWDDGCFRARRVSATGIDGQAEAVTYAHQALKALCETDWPTTLCGRVPVCGDGICSGTETSNSCVDCATPVCGNARCEADELSDCADCRAAQPEAPVAEPAEEQPVGCRTAGGRAPLYLVGLALLIGVRRERRCERG